MQEIITFVQNNFIICLLLLFNIILLFLFIRTNNNLARLRKSYSDFMSKLGNGNNIDEMIKKYIDKVTKVEENQNEINIYCKNIENNIKKCVQKIGIVRYNAFKDTGSDLSFSIALLDNEDNGIILNSIYARDGSNMYAKPVKQGKSSYVLSKEEQSALDIAMSK